MKTARTRNAAKFRKDERSLCRALLALRSEAECSAFLSDLCTPAELEALVDRWSVVGLLQDGLPYRRIHELTGVSVTTIGRVARFLTAGNGGYRKVLDRMAYGRKGKD
jgi:TrpR-related protein YerC/YecD